MNFDKTIAAIHKSNLTEQEKNTWANYLDIKNKIKEGTIFDDIREVATFIENHLNFDGNIFRGQIKNWPIKSSGWRIPEGERDKRWVITMDFMKWVLNNPYLKPFHEPPEKLEAIAQHYSYEYSLITPLIDFTYDYKVACFFATDFKSIVDEDIGVVIVANIPSMKVCYNYMGIDGIKQFNIEGLWRLNNQKGLFLKDVNGDFEIFGRFIKLFFKQNLEVKFETEYINLKSIYPIPNSFEEEINRYLDIKLRSRSINEIDPDNLFEKIEVARDPICVEFEKQIVELNWVNEENLHWKTIELIPYVTTEISADTVEIMIDDYDYSKLTSNENNNFHELIKHIDKVGSTSFTPKINLNSNIIDPLLNKDIASQIFTGMISEFSKNYGKIPFDISHKISSLKILALFAIQKSYNLKTVISDDLDILCMTYRTGKLTFIEMEDYQGIVSKAYIDRDFCESLMQMTHIREQFNNYFKGRKGFLNDKKDELIEINLHNNYQLFQFVNKAKALFSWNDVIWIWALYVIPYQILFRANSHSIFNPYYLEKCGLA